METRMNLLDDKYVQFWAWISHITDKRGLDSTLTIAQITEMLEFLNENEKRMDRIILKVFETQPSQDKT